MANITSIKVGRYQSPDYVGPFTKFHVRFQATQLTPNPVATDLIKLATFPKRFVPVFTSVRLSGAIGLATSTITLRTNDGTTQTALQAALAADAASNGIMNVGLPLPFAADWDLEFLVSTANLNNALTAYVEVVAMLADRGGD